MNKDLISRSALKKQLRKKQLKKKICLDKDAEFERGYHFAINVCINLLNIFPTVEAYTKEDIKKVIEENEKLSLLYSDMANEIARLKSMTGER